MSKMKGYTAMMMAMSMMAGGMPMYEREATSIKREKRPPHGSREYFFNMKGEFSTDHMLITDVVFECFAINDKNAIKKFNKSNHNA